MGRFFGLQQTFAVNFSTLVRDRKASACIQSSFQEENLTVFRMAAKIDNLSRNMDKKRLDSFKKRLEERQQALRRTVSRTEEDGRIADQDPAQDIADRAASSYTKEFLFSQSNNERQLLQMVETALARIREGTFGECVSCGDEINAKRLEAVPWTRYCIACQEKKENGQLEEAHD